MKKLILIVLIAFVTNAKAQITLEFTQDSASSLVLAASGVTTQDQLMIVDFEVSGYQYVKVNRHVGYISIYNMGHALVQTISLAGFPKDGSSFGYILYLSETLFNTDSKKEFMYAQSFAGNNYYTGIYNEDGIILFSDSAYPAVIGTYAMQQWPIYNTPQGTKMLLSYPNGKVKVFDLGGTLSCSSACSATSNSTGQRSISPPNNNGLGNAYPNPSNNATTIPYTLPTGTNQGEIVFYNVRGTEVKRFKVDNTFSTLLISTTDIPAGTYYYQLLINGNASAAKKMVVVK